MKLIPFIRVAFTNWLSRASLPTIASAVIVGLVVVLVLGLVTNAHSDSTGCDNPQTTRALVLEQRELIEDLRLQGESLTARIVELETAHGTYQDDDYEVDELPPLGD